MPRKRKQDAPKNAEPIEPIEPAEPAEPAVRPPVEGEARDYTELVLLVHAGNPAEAELIKTELEANGIPAVIEGEGAGVAGIPDVGAGVPVLVPEEFVDQAAELIAELESAKPEGTALTDKDDDVLDEDEDEEALEVVDEVDEVEDEEADDEDLDDDDEDDEDDEWEEDEDDLDDAEDDEEWEEDDDEEDFEDDDDV
jgi:hypothetical protein